MRVLVMDVLRLADVVKSVPWALSLSSDEFLRLVHHKLELNDLESRPFSEVARKGDIALNCEDYHAARVAYFVEKGWTEPIHIDVGVPGLTDLVWPIADGNHRLFAAYIRGDEAIQAELQGSVPLLEECFGEGCCPD